MGIQEDMEEKLLSKTRDFEKLRRYNILRAADRGRCLPYSLGTTGFSNISSSFCSEIHWG